MQKITIQQATQRVGDTPSNLVKSAEDLLAWDIARYFDDSYYDWKMAIVRSGKHLGDIEHEFHVLKGKDFGLENKARMLMATIRK